MRKMLLVAVALMFALPAFANPIPVVDWECGYTVLGLYGTGDPPIIATNVGDPDPVYEGLRSLRLEDNSPSGTPQAYVAWVRGLADGDTVSACIWRYDTTPGASPSCRIWAHWNDDPDDVNGYNGSAGGNDDYGPGTGWDQTCWTWYVETSGHTGLVIEVRTYSNPGDTVWVDELIVDAPMTAEIVIPECDNPVNNATWSSIKALYH
jgi:hypothetical protein